MNIIYIMVLLYAFVSSGVNLPVTVYSSVATQHCLETHHSITYLYWSLEHDAHLSSLDN